MKNKINRRKYKRGWHSAEENGEIRKWKNKLLFQFLFFCSVPVCFLVSTIISVMPLYIWRHWDWVGNAGTWGGESLMVLMAVSGSDAYHHCQYPNYVDERVPVQLFHRQTFTFPVSRSRLALNPVSYEIIRYIRINLNSNQNSYLYLLCWTAKMFIMFVFSLKQYFVG